MIVEDESALECDLAETYRIYDYRVLTPDRVALFSVGLRENSRIKLKLSGQKYSFETLLLASAVDRLSFLVWSKTKDAENNRNRPVSIVEKLTEQEKEKDFVVFDSAEDFEQALAQIKRKEV